MSFLERLHDSIDARIAETQREIDALQSALAVLRDETPAPTPAPRSAAPRRRRRRTPQNGNAASAEAAPAVVPAAPAPAPAATARRAPTKPAAKPAPAKPASAKPASAKPASAKPAPAKPAPAPAAAKVKPPAGRSVQTLTADRLEEMLGSATDGLSAISIAKQAGAGYNQVLTLLRQLEASDRVRRTGTRRTSLWRLVTDEERIAERAAELAARA